MTPATINDTGSTLVAGAAVVSPVWLPMIEESSKMAGLLLPILGCTFLVIQIIYHIWKR